MYGQSQWHSFWQQRVVKEKRALASHLREYYGPEGAKILSSLQEHDDRISNLHSGRDPA